MRKLLIVGSLLLLAAAVIVLPALAKGHSLQHEHGTLTVPPRGPGEDYKSIPAKPELPAAAPETPLSEGEIQRIYDSFDPDDSPYVRVCVNPNGSGSAQFLSPWDPGAKEVPPPTGVVEKDIELINDKGSC